MNMLLAVFAAILAALWPPHTGKRQASAHPATRMANAATATHTRTARSNRTRAYVSTRETKPVLVPARCPQPALARPYLLAHEARLARELATRPTAGFAPLAGMTGARA